MIVHNYIKKYKISFLILAPVLAMKKVKFIVINKIDFLEQNLYKVKVNHI